MDRLPHDLEAEKAFLGAILHKSDLIWEAMQKVKPVELYHVQHRVIYEAMVDISENGDGKIDLVTLPGALRDRGEYEMAGGAIYLSGLFDVLPDVANIDAYCQIIVTAARSRTLIEIGRELQTQQDPDEALGHAMNRLMEVADRSDNSESKVLEDVGEEYRENQQQGIMAQMFTTGIPMLDNIVTFRKENMVVIAGHPGTGKSSLGLQIAMNVMKQGHVLFVSMEMGKAELWERAVQARTGCAAEVIDNPKFVTPEVRDKIAKASSELRGGPRTLEVFAPRYCTPQTILGKAMAMKAQHSDFKAVVVDFLQRVHWPERGLGPVDETTKKSRAMKDMARIIGAPMIVLSQLSRNSAREGKEPQLHDLRDSGAIEQDADTAIFTHRPSEESNDAVLLVRKQRHGPKGRVECIFDEARCRFIEKTRSYSY